MQDKKKLDKKEFDAMDEITKRAEAAAETPARRLTKEEVLVAKLMQARQILAARGRMIADLKAENARLQGEVMGLAAQLEDVESTHLRAEYDFPARYQLQQKNGEFFLQALDE
jgi:hypothetical protein